MAPHPPPSTSVARQTDRASSPSMPISVHTHTERERGPVDVDEGLEHVDVVIAVLSSSDLKRRKNRTQEQTDRERKTGQKRKGESQVISGALT